MRDEILALIAEAYRTDNKLAELIDSSKTSTANDFSRLATLGALYEETGQVDKALATYRGALAIAAQHRHAPQGDPPLQTAGELDKPSTSTRRSSSRAEQPRFRVRALRDADPARRSAARARKLVRARAARVERRGDARRLADFYERIEENDSDRSRC